MERVGYVEVLDRRLRVKERTRFSRFPITIGRAYTNDFILDDRFACPHHLRILADEDGGFTAEDLGSANGTRPWKADAPEARIRLAPDTVIRVGQTLLRLRDPAARVPEAAALPATRGDAISVRGLLQSTSASLSLFGLCFGAWLIGAFLSNTDRSPMTGLFGDALLVLFILLSWAGAWALVNRAVAHDFQFGGHLAIAAAGVLGFMLLHTVSEYWGFLLSTGPSLEAMQIATGLVPSCAALYGHLSLTWNAEASRRFAVAALVAVSLVGLFRFNLYLDEQSFSPAVEFPAELKPAPAHWIRAVTPDEFFARTEAIKGALDRGTEDFDD